ncbi:LacI family DNA-binding transcriptional regulator [Tropicimonas sp. IMCC34043]|uniref:LacI family DNA-binding transcriptional regulator n=1 Tax=Tropicimonas sp. IMCC34043 TaxID=2248760 RepID=UPI000E23A61E|nr:LacI family DNA-binding transcriptional regulator [Tropicimonas sp. IMCC34043]
MANLKHVAKAAGVSVTTVSRYLNRSLDLPDDTANRINGAILALNYVPNPHARRLSLGRTDTIGLVVPEIATPFFATFVAAVEEEADRRGLTLALHATLNRAEREVLYLDALRRNHMDGLIFVTNHAGTDPLAEIINQSSKVVVVDEDVPGARVPKLFCDNEAGGYLAGRCLAQAGHRHAMFVGSDDAMISGARRFSGFRRAMQENGSDVTIERFSRAYTVECGREAGRHFLNAAPRPTAIFATSDEIVVGLIEVLRDAGISIPREVSIVGFDDIGPLHLFAPAVTAVRQPIRRLGKRALELLLDTDAATAENLPQEELLPVTLIERDSVAAPFGT